jgi:oligopeptide/dipeptide ABC transporter ATP-binding protein
MSLLEIDDLVVRYRDVAAVDKLSFAVDRGESVGLVGESGSGKSQTALSILGLLPANAQVHGSIRFDGDELIDASEAELDCLRATRIAMVFQDPAQALNPYVSIGAQLSRILLQHGLSDGAEARERVIAMLDRVGLPDASRQYRAYSHELSGGMRQRAMIASALLAGPDLLIADEPTTALDVTVQAQILDLLEEVREDTALLLITHDLGIVAGRCQRMIVLEKGRLVEEGETRAVFAAPAHEHTRALLRAAPRLDQAIAPGPRKTKTALEIDGAEVQYATSDGHQVPAVKGVSLQVRHGETVAVVGESGSGKSSLVRGVLGLEPLRAGRVVCTGSGMQLVFQDPRTSLNPQMRVTDLVGEPLVVHKPSLSRDERRGCVVEMLEKTGIGREYLERYPHELSGGQAQRVAIARALILRPSVLVCDEAVAALDGTVREQILELLREIQAESGLSIIFITHDLAVARSISHRVSVLYLGELVEQATTAELFAHPRHPYTQALLSAIPVPDPQSPGGKSSVVGEVPSALEPPPGCAFHPRCPHAKDQCRVDRPAAREVGATTVSCHLAEELASAHH